MTDKEKYIVKLDGVVMGKGEIDQVPHEEFLDSFLEWLESKGYCWFGHSVQTDENGKHIDDKVRK